MTRLFAILALWSVTSLLFHVNPVLVTGLPVGASQCPRGIPAVGGCHLTKDEIVTSSLMNSTAELQLLLNGQPLSATSPTDVKIGVDHTLELIGASPFRGFLFRLGAAAGGIDTTGSLLLVEDDAADDAAMVQVADTVCVQGEDVGGLTHTNSVDKTSIKGLLRIDEVAENLTLDVTVVISNEGSVSDYAYTGYKLNAVAEESSPSTTNAPTAPSSSGIQKMTIVAMVLSSLSFWSMLP
jgi:hypothetical protein